MGAARPDTVASTLPQAGLPSEFGKEISMRLSVKPVSIGLFAALLLPLSVACSGNGDWQDRAEGAVRTIRARAADLGDRLDDLRARLAERVDSTRVRYADELAAIDRRRQEIEAELEEAAKSGEKQWKKTSARLEKELEELEKRAEELREHVEDPF
jgi:hypothetical protein